jgi:GntR family transcriptional regulator
MAQEPFMPNLRSPIPLYYQIATTLEGEITSGAIPENSTLPSEKELAKRFGVSLVTVRAAMRSLSDQHLIDRRPGKGTVVLATQARAVWELGWLNDLVASVTPSHLEIVSMGLTTAPSWVAQRFGIERGARVHHMDTIRFLRSEKDEPFLTTRIYHPRDIAASFQRRDFQSEATQGQWVISIVEAKCGLRIKNVRQTMSAKLADEDIASRLQIDIGMAVLEVTRDYFDGSGRLIQTGRSLYRSDRFEYVLNLSRSGQPGRDGFNELKEPSRAMAREEMPSSEPLKY